MNSMNVKTIADTLCTHLKTLIQSQLAVLFAGTILVPTLSTAGTGDTTGQIHLTESSASDSNVRRPFVNPYYEQRHGQPEVYRWG